MTEEQKHAFEELLATLVLAVEVTGDEGAPGGHLYAPLMGLMSASTFEALMQGLVQRGKLVKRGQVYYAVKPATPNEST